MAMGHGGKGAGRRRGMRNVQSQRCIRKVKRRNGTEDRHVMASSQKKDVEDVEIKRGKDTVGQRGREEEG